MVDLTVASFFSGIGLLDLGLEWAGFRTVSFSENEPYASARLAQRFPGVPNLGDIHGITDVPEATVWAGGFPCQPVSVAGRMAAQDDERWLWPVWARLIRDLRPRHLILENVSNILAVNGGRAFGDVLGDLAAFGYDAEWDCIPAKAVGAPHQRDRVWIIGTDTHRAGRGIVERGQSSVGARNDSHRLREDVADARGGHGGTGRPRRPQYRGQGLPQHAHDVAHSIGAGGQRRRAASRQENGAPAEQEPRSHRPPRSIGEFRRDAGRWWAAEPDVGRVAHGVPNRVDRLRCLGNGVVPQVAEFIGWKVRAMIEADEMERAA